MINIIYLYIIIINDYIFIIDILHQHKEIYIYDYTQLMGTCIPLYNKVLGHCFHMFHMNEMNGKANQGGFFYQCTDQIANTKKTDYSL